MTNQEAFALHVASLFSDAINGHIGVLRSLAEKISIPVGIADELEKKRQRAIGDCIEFVGGEEKWKEIKAEDVANGFVPSTEKWTKKVMVLQERKSTRYFLAENDEMLFRHARMILQKRVSDGWYKREDEMYEEIVAACFGVDDKAFKVLEKRSRVENEWFDVCNLETTY